jgi:hypothetical protein
MADNAFVQVFLFLALFYLFLYSLKLFFIIKFEKKKAVVAYLVLLGACLAFLYIGVVDWESSDATNGGNWFGPPILLMTIPTITFIYDLVRREKGNTVYLIARSVLEVFVVFPIWFTMMLFVFGFLGWINW